MDHYEADVDLDDISIGEKDKHSYRVLMYSKLDVEALERVTMREMLQANKSGPYGDAFLIKAAQLFPEMFPELSNKKKRGKKSTIYFIEDVGKYLWAQWKTTGDFDKRNDFLTYCYPLIDGVIFKYQRHKHGLSYDEIFQGAVLKLIQAIDKFDPNRVVGKDDKGRDIYARIYTYATLVLNYGICTITMSYGAEKINNVSYDSLSRVIDDYQEGHTDAHIIYQEFLLFLESLLSVKEELSDPQYEILTALRDLVYSKEGNIHVVNNLIGTLKTKTGYSEAEIKDTLQFLREFFGPLVINSDRDSLSAKYYFDVD